MVEGVRLPQVGEVIAGKYRLKRLLGEGGMGSVLEAEHLKLRQTIAIKFLNPSMLGVDEIIQRFEREARAAATLRSRHVVRVTDVEATPDGVPYMVMELLAGVDLESERERRQQLPYSEAVDYVLQACAALSEAHDAGIVHRDLKPGNLFLAQEDGDRIIVKVLDFGISKFLHGDDVKLTSAGAIMGTALYMSPEQIRGDASIDARSDIWALGVILYELISGAAPWTGASTRVAAGIVSESVPDLLKVVPSVPPALANAIYKMLEKLPANRFGSIREVVMTIASFAPSGSVGASVAENLARRSQQNFPREALAFVDNTPASAPSPSITKPMTGRPESDPAIAVAPPSSGNVGSESGSPSDKIPLIQRAATNANNPEQRSTMNATTTSANMKLARPSRVLWGVVAALATLAVAGGGLIVFARNNGGASGAGKEITKPSAPAAVVSADPVVSASPPLSPSSSSASASAPSQTPSVIVAATATATTSTAGAGAAVALPTKKPPTTPGRPTPPPAQKPVEPPPAPPPPINPPFLK